MCQLMIISQSFEISILSVNIKPLTPHLRFGSSTHTLRVNFQRPILSLQKRAAKLSILALTSCRQAPHLNPRPGSRDDNTAEGELCAVAEAAAKVNARIWDLEPKQRMCQHLQITLMTIRRR
jgi:hypothetical protein